MVELLNRRLKKKETERDRGREMKEKQMSYAAVTERMVSQSKKINTKTTTLPPSTLTFESLTQGLGKLVLYT